MEITRREFLAGAGITAIYLSLPDIAKAESEEKVQDIECPIYYFHQIPSQNWFESNLYNLVSNDFFPVALRDISQYFTDGQKTWPSAKKPLVLTFDDGFLNQYQNAVPVLSKWQINATFFVMPDWKGDGDTSHIYMNNEHFVELAQNWEIGSHTFHHPDLVSERLSNFSNWQAEIKGSKERLEEIIGQKVVSFAYPFGAYDLQTLEFTSFHYQIAVATNKRIILSKDQRFALPRLSG